MGPSTAAVEVKERYYPDGTLYSRERFVEGKREGRSEYYSQEGRLRTSLEYRQGLLNGEALLYWPSSRLKRRTHFRQGVREGREEIWGEEGTLLDEGEYRGGKPVGTHLRYHRSGKKLEEVVYQEGGAFQYRSWDEEGTLRLSTGDKR